ncbi:MAG: sodium:calcium antiporter [FCB group bacterium]|jgi:cation:H+ antiporter|nr:sodium:calcium antiporter [FCB group bacterium]
MTRVRQITPIIVAILMTFPGIGLRLSGAAIDAPLEALVSGTAILGAAFLLTWVCGAAQADIPQALALACVALIAVLPEYAIDMYFTWQAGQFPESDYASFAVANMTGANQLLVGVAWVAIVVVFWLKTGKMVVLERERGMEIGFLALATVYAFLIPLKGTLAWYDGVVLVGIYVWYIIKAGGGDLEECDADGSAELLINLPKVKRRVTTALLFLLAGGAVLANAQPFSEGLIETGELLEVNRFLLVQWLAPIASEAPEFTLAIMFAMRRQPSMALGSLLSAMLNQWTLLVGMIPGVYAISHGTLEHPIPMVVAQLDEILMTASQSLLGLALLALLTLSVRQAALLLALFLSQSILPNVLSAQTGLLPPWLGSHELHHFFAGIYVAFALVLVMARAPRIVELWRPSKVVRRRAILPAKERIGEFEV